MRGALIEQALTGPAPLFFMHIPKTAGATLIQAIEGQFDEREIARWLYPFRLVDEPAAFFRAHRYFHGHVEYAIMRGLLAEAPVTLTMLRDPVERYLSQFGNHARVALSSIPDWIPEIYERFQRTSLAEFVWDPPEVLRAESLNWHNKHASMLAFELADEGDGAWRRTDACRPYRREVLSAPTLAAARRRLDELAFVGITERFQESLFLLAYTFGWPPVVEYEIVNDAPPGLRPSRDGLPRDLLDEIRRVNAIDQQLYDHARAAFEIRYQRMCGDLLERYGGRAHAALGLPLAFDVVAELLDAHHRRRFRERHPAVPSLRFNPEQQASGGNWQVRERDLADRSFRWSGPGRCATLDLPLSAESDVWLRVNVLMAITEDVMASLVVSVNDEPIAMSYAPVESGGTVGRGRVPRAVLARRPGCVRVAFTIDGTVQPRKVIPGSVDDRRLGIALHWLEIEPAREP